MKFPHHNLMPNGLFRKIALGTAIAGSAVLGAREAKAVPVAWGKFEDCIKRHNSDYPSLGGISTAYAANSINFKDQNGNLLTSNPQFSLVYFTYTTSGGLFAAGGLNGSGTTASGWFNSKGGGFTGLTTGQTANYPNVDNGYWRMFVDVNGNGKYGTYDSSNGLFIPEENEMITDTSVFNFQGFQTGAVTLSAGDFSGWYTVPDPTTGTLTALGIVALTLRWDVSQCISSIDVSASGTNINKCAVFLLSKTNLNQTSWTTNVTVAITGAVTSVTTTNAVPNLFFKVTEKSTP